jgi:hypothetical protein
MQIRVAFDIPDYGDEEQHADDKVKSVKNGTDDGRILAAEQGDKLGQ